MGLKSMEGSVGTELIFLMNQSCMLYAEIIKHKIIIWDFMSHQK